MCHRVTCTCSFSGELEAVHSSEELKLQQANKDHAKLVSFLQKWTPLTTTVDHCSVLYRGCTVHAIIMNLGICDLIFPKAWGIFTSPFVSVD